MSFGCERSCSSPRRVSNFNSKVPQGGIYPHIKFERDMSNIFRVRVFTSSGSTGGRDAKTIISPNTSFGDIIIAHQIYCTSDILRTEASAALPHHLFVEWSSWYHSYTI